MDLERSRGFWVLEQAQGKVLEAVKARIDEAWGLEQTWVKSEMERAWNSAATVGGARAASVRALQECLEEFFGRPRLDAERLAEDSFQHAVSYLANEYQELLDRLLKTAGEWFNTQMPKIVLEIPSPPRSRFYVHVPPELVGVSSAGGSIVNLLPAGFGGAFIKKGLVKKIGLFYQMQRDRLLSDVAERMQDQAGVVVTGLESAISSLLSRLKETIERGLTLHERTQAEKEAALAWLASKESRARALLARLNYYGERELVDFCEGPLRSGNG